MPEESLQKISFANGALELETPEDGATIGNPPNGGLRAWLIVLSCFGINILQSIMLVLIRYALLLDDEDHSMTSDTGIDTDTLQKISDEFLNMADIYSALAAIVMILYGCVNTVVIGAGVVMSTLFFLSYLGDDDTEGFIKFLIYGPAAIGLSFIRLGSLIPVLEYFTTKRLKALFLSRLGLYIGEIILIGIFFIPNLKYPWRVCLRASSALCIGIGLIGLTLKDLKLTMKNDQTVTFLNRTLGLAKKDILRNVLLWITCVVFFFYQWGIEPAQEQLTNSETRERLKFDDDIAKSLSFSFSQPIGLVVGMFSAWMFKKAALKEDSCFYSIKLSNNLWNVIVVILMINTLTMGITCIIAPHVVDLVYFLPFSVIYYAFIAFGEGTRDDIIPVQFGRDNIRFVEGLIFMASGLGGVITNEISAKISDDGKTGWNNNFYYGGGVLLFTTAVIAFVLFLKERKALDQIIIGGEQSKVQTNTNMERNSIRRDLNTGITQKQLSQWILRGDDKRQSNSPNQTNSSAEPIYMNRFLY